MAAHGVGIDGSLSRLFGLNGDKITAQKISQDMETLSHKLEDMEKNICRAI